MNSHRANRANLLATAPTSKNEVGAAKWRYKTATAPTAPTYFSKTKSMHIWEDSTVGAWCADKRCARSVNLLAKQVGAVGAVDNLHEVEAAPTSLQEVGAIGARLARLAPGWRGCTPTHE